VSAELAGTLDEPFLGNDAAAAPTGLFSWV